MITNKGFIAIGIAIVFVLISLAAYYMLYRCCMKKPGKILNMLTAGAVMLMAGMLTGIAIKILWFVIQSFGIVR